MGRYRCLRSHLGQLSLMISATEHRQIVEKISKIPWTLRCQHREDSKRLEDCRLNYRLHLNPLQQSFVVEGKGWLYGPRIDRWLKRLLDRRPAPVLRRDCNTYLIVFTVSDPKIPGSRSRHVFRGEPTFSTCGRPSLGRFMARQSSRRTSTP